MIAMIDNYDSFTYNLVQYFGELGADIQVFRNDQVSLPELAALFSKCRILVSNDTGPMHLGAAVGVPTLGIFSIARPEHYSPLGRFSRYVRSRSIKMVAVETVYAEFLQIQASIRKANLDWVGPTDSKSSLDF